MKLDNLHAVVLHRRPYRETSYLVDFFTRELGKVSAVCKGVRSSKSEKKSLLQPFQTLTIGLFGKHELKNLGQLEADQTRYALIGPRMFSAMYLNELLNRTLPLEIPCQGIYDLYLASLLRLLTDEGIEPILREFELHLLGELGYAIDWHTEWRTGEGISAAQHYTFVAQHGLQRLAEGQQSKHCFLGENLIKIANNQWDKSSLQAAKRIARLAFLPLLGDKPLKSRELFQQLELPQ